MATVRIEYFGADGEGPTLTAAKADAGRKIERMMQGDYTPEIVAFGNHAILIWREPRNGYQYRMIQSGNAIEAGRVWGAGAFGCLTMAEAKENIVCHLAQNAWDGTNGDALLAWLPKTKRETFAAWLRFQIAYRLYESQGFSGHECHQLACGAMEAKAAA